ncbi:MAG: ATP-binding protein, partial [Betaproteobacteria bacterium]|nr:ATP-binding protein [Betaproteobacteria bacterium]
LAHSAGAPTERLSAVDQGFSNSTSGGRRWRVYSQWDERRRTLIQVAETLDARRAIGRELASHLIAPLGVALPMLAIALVLLIRASLAPLSRLADSIGSRSPERLDPIARERAPRELHPIVEQLNRLFDRVARSLEQERRFTADAAHELRTPLAAMRAHAQVARASRDAAERDLALDRMVESVDRATHLLEQLLTLARLDAASIAGGFARCDLREPAAQAIAEVAPMALAKSIELALAESAAIEVTGDRTLLAVMLRNLIDNAVRYAPPGSRVEVSLGRGAHGGAWIEVVDQGPGIAAEERDRVLDRFYRVSGAGGSGSGLGLSIVARIAQLHAAQLGFADAPGGRGVSARLEFAQPNPG